MQSSSKYLPGTCCCPQFLSLLAVSFVLFVAILFAMKTILLLGSGELGKEFTIALQRLGQRVIACDRYANAPAMQVAHAFEVFEMLDGEALAAAVEKHRPDIIVPEVEAIRTEKLVEFEARGIHVVPSARAAHFTMNRRAIRDLAARELGLKTAPYEYAATREEFEAAVQKIGLPCVAKPLMSSSGKGQSTLRTAGDIEAAWEYGISGGRGDQAVVIVEGFVEFETEITLLTVTQQGGPTLFCAPIGHVQERGDYMESWQPCAISRAHLEEAQQMAAKVTGALGGAGIWGVEFFLARDGVYFSELSPRPHDTGMVTLAQTQNLSEFELHARAVLGLPIPRIELLRAGASAVVLAERESSEHPKYSGVADALSEERVDVRIFGKPSTRKHRRMAVVLAYDEIGCDMDALRDKAKRAAAKVKVV
jgi:phosphoribosylglycinamide formyltransferase 2